MATFTITTTVNIDTLVGRTGGDTFNINGGALTIDEDSRYGLNSNTSAIIGTVTPSASLGGSFFVDGRSIWLIPYNTGSGNVPAYNTTISKGSASGLLIGVYSALNVAPTTPGSAMPASGYIKVKQWNGTLYGTGALTGIGATATSGETVGWIEPVGQEGTLCLLSSLNQSANGGYFSRGDWYTVGTTSGSRATTYQIPTNGVDVYHGGVLVDKAAATNISAMSWSSGTMTVTSTGHGLSTNDRVMIDGTTPRALRTIDTVTITVVDANTFTYPLASNPGTYTSGGTVAAVEWYPITNTVNTKIGTDAYRGKVAWLDQTTGLLRFGNDGTTSTGGYLPTSGLVIRLPNIMTSNSTSGSRTTNSLNAAVASRWRWYNGALGIAKSSHMSGTWSPSVFQTGKQVIMSDSAHHGQLSISSQSGGATVTNVCVGGNGTTTTGYALNLNSMFTASTFTDCVFNGNDTGSVSHIGINTSSVYDATFTRCKAYQTGDKGSANFTVTMSIGSGITFQDCHIGGAVTSSQVSNVTMTDTVMWHSSYGRTQFTGATMTFRLQNLSQNWLVDGVTFPTQAGSGLGRSSFLDVTGSSDNGVFRNIGTRAAPIDMRLNGYQDGKPWTRVTTTATVTETGHPYSVGDQVALYQSSSTGTITLVNKTITAVTANTFDFACLNTGPTSGTVSYFVGGTQAGFSLQGALQNWKIQNVHILGLLGTLNSMSAYDYGVTLQDITLEPRAYNSAPTWTGNNVRANSIYIPDYSLQGGVVTTGIQGTHFMDAFMREPSVPGQSAAVTGATWTRSTSTITVTSTNHGLWGGSQRIWIENSSSEAAVANGWGASASSLIVVDANTFTFTGANAGAASGTLDYKIMGDSIFQCKMTEESSATTGQSTITVNSGAAGFTGAGTLTLPAVGDQVVFETPDYMTAFTNFGLTPALPYGSAITSLAATQQFDIQYQLNTGSGFGSWRNAAYFRTRSSGGTSGTNTMDLTAIGDVAVGDFIMGVGVPSGTYVTNIATNTITLNNNFTANASGVYTFWYMPNESAFPSTGIKLKVRVTTNTANSAAFYQVDFPMLSNSTTRGYLYDQTTQYTLTLTGLISGSDIVVLEAGTTTPRVNVDNNSGTTYAYVHSDAISGTDVDICVYKTGYIPYILRNITLESDNTSLPIQQVVDRNYSNP